MLSFMELLRARWDQGLSLCVGLDSDFDKLPGSILKFDSYDLETDDSQAEKIFMFNKAIVRSTAQYAAAFKLNFAFYLAYGPSGINALRRTIFGIKWDYPEMPVILDVKVGDIGNTNDFYVKAFLTTFMQADAITVHNYLGQKAMQPFLDQKNKGIFVLCCTSNQGAEEFQDQKLLLSRNELDERYGQYEHNLAYSQCWFYQPGMFLIKQYQDVAMRVSRQWNSNNNCGLVTGATYPGKIEIVRNLVGDVMPLLIPGIGKQGGDLEKTVKAARRNFLINVSSGITSASTGEDYRSSWCSRPELP